MEPVRNVLVIHPRFTLFGGGELLCLQTIKALQEKAYHVTLASDSYLPATCEAIFGPIGNVLRTCDYLPLPMFKRILPRFMIYQRVRYAGKVKALFEKADPEIVFSTQSTLYFVPGMENFHMIYDIVDLSIIKLSREFQETKLKLPYYLLLRKYRSTLERPKPSRHFLALSKSISTDLAELGYANQLVIPPCPLDYSPLPKKRQVVQVTRVVPQKRLEQFQDIAEALPQFDFHIVGMTNESFKTYRDKLLRKMPRNVHYHEMPLRKKPELLQESKVYLYTSHEPGLPIALVQGIGAGCFPIVPSTGGGREAVEIAGHGLIYQNIKTAAFQVEKAMNMNINVEKLALAAKQFSPEAYREKIKSLVP